MTVCIAAINEKHKLIAFATDRMVTATFPPIEFEHVIPKITQINDYCIALSAGDAIRGKEIFDVVRQTAQKANPPVKQIAEHIKEVYQQKRLQILEVLHLRSRGINHKAFIEAGAKFLPPPVYAQIDHAFTTFALALEILVAGVDESGPNIYGIRNPGLLDCYNPIGFHAIGSGTMHALISLIESYNPTTSEVGAVYSVFRAKKVAEVAPGVGKKTDLGMVIYKQKIKYFDETTELFNKLSELCENETEVRKNLTMKSELDTLSISDEGTLTTKTITKQRQNKTEELKR